MCVCALSNAHWLAGSAPELLNLPLKYLPVSAIEDESSRVWGEGRPLWQCNDLHFAGPACVRFSEWYAVSMNAYVYANVSERRRAELMA